MCVLVIYMQESRHNIQRTEAITKHYSGLISGVLDLNTLEGFWCLPLSSFFLASPGSTWTSWRMRGRLVTIPVPRGSRSLPTRLSSTELLPLLWRHKQQTETQVLDEGQTKGTRSSIALMWRHAGSGATANNS